MPISKGLLASLTPIEEHGGYLVKRDDLYSEAGIAWGGKARTAGLLCKHAKAGGITELCVAVDRNSSVPGMLARVCRSYGIGLHIWYPESNAQLPPVFVAAQYCGAILHGIRPGYMSVRRARLREYVASSGGKAIEVGLGLLLTPPGAQYPIGTFQTMQASGNVQLAFDAGRFERLVVPYGSGGMLYGIVRGLWPRVPILAVCCGHLPTAETWSPYPNLTFQTASVPFEKPVLGALGSLKLDPVYEAKCLEFLRKGDMLWIVAHRETQ